MYFLCRHIIVKFSPAVFIEFSLICEIRLHNIDENRPSMAGAQTLTKTE